MVVVLVVLVVLWAQFVVQLSDCRLRSVVNSSIIVISPMCWQCTRTGSEMLRYFGGSSNSRHIPACYAKGLPKAFEHRDLVGWPENKQHSLGGTAVAAGACADVDLV